MAVSITRLDHVNLSIDDVGAAKRFYGELLGLRAAPRPADAGARAGCWFSTGSFEIHLSEERGADNATSKRHLAFEVADLAAARSALEAAGVAIEHARVVTGIERFFARDPSGNRLEFFVRVG